MVSWDHSVDFVVVGSGAAGMTAAVRAHDLGGEALVVEKAPVFGGSTALSGGVVWVPNNPLMARAGIGDSAEEVDGFLDGPRDVVVPDADDAHDGLWRGGGVSEGRSPDGETGGGLEARLQEFPSRDRTHSFFLPCGGASINLSLGSGLSHSHL